MSAQQVVFQYLSAGSNTLTVPAGFSNQVLVYAWGAGGGTGYNGPAGGGGGFVEGILTVNSGDTMVIAVGSRGGQGPRDGQGLGGTNSNPVLSFDGGTTGVARPQPYNDDQNYGAGGGGGAATAVFVNGVPMIVAAGGGGGGGGRSYQTGTVGFAGGIATQTSETQRGGASADAYSVGGGGGAGYPLGGAGGISKGDDAGQSTGGYGGQNYANVLVTSSTLSAGSGTIPGGVDNALYPRASRGYAGYDGAVIVIFTKSFRAWIKDTTWKEATNAWFKIPSSSTTLYRTIPPTTNRYESGTHTFVVPAGVFSLTVSSTGGGGGGQTGWGNYSGSGGGGAGGSAGSTVNTTISVTPGQTLNIFVGAGGLGGAGSFAGGTSPQGPAGLNGGASYITGYPATNAAGGAGGYKGSSGTYSNSIGNWAGDGGSWWYGFAGENSAIGTGGTRGEVNTNGGRGGPGAGGGGGAASNYSPNDSQTSGGGGGTGVITLSYSSEPIAEIVETGGWKRITGGWIKENNEWKSIQSGVSLVPVPSTSETVTINLTIAANTNNYVLSDFLSGTSYNPGRSIVNLTVEANVIVGSTSVGSPALVIDGLATGDFINLINNGNIAGAGGRGGAAGQYTVTNTPIYNSKGQPVYSDSKGRIQATNTSVTSVPGRPGEVGGPALFVTYTTNLVNNGTIAGGGGGGGGGGGPTGGQGGGGAGRTIGTGANNGTLTAGGAGTGLGGAGGARGTAGSAGTNDTNIGGRGGDPGAAIIGIDKIIIATEGTIIGARKVDGVEAG